MGASEFILKQRGKDRSDAFKQAYDDAQEEHGHQEGYSGAINCTSLAGDKTADYKKSGLSINKYIDKELESCHKRNCYSICVKEPVINKSKIKSQVEHIINKGTAKWILEYSVYEYDQPIKSFFKKGLAVSCARAHTEKTGRRTSVVMEKHLESGSHTVAMISYKQSKNEAPGEWVFFGLAPS